LKQLCYFLIFALTSHYSCIDQRNEESRFKLYLEDIGLQAKQNDIYYLINVNYCEACVSAHIENLKNLPDTEKLAVIFVGKLTNNKWKDEINQLSWNKTKIYYDQRSIGTRMRINLDKTYAGFFSKW